jgi:hypothetical protein
MQNKKIATLAGGLKTRCFTTLLVESRGRRSYQTIGHVRLTTFSTALALAPHTRIDKWKDACLIWSETTRVRCKRCYVMAVSLSTLHAKVTFHR